MKTPLKQRRQCALYKCNNWEKIKEYQKLYMRKYRAKRSGLKSLLPQIEHINNEIMKPYNYTVL